MFIAEGYLNFKETKSQDAIRTSLADLEAKYGAFCSQDDENPEKFHICGEIQNPSCFVRELMESDISRLYLASGKIRLYEDEFLVKKYVFGSDGWKSEEGSHEKCVYLTRQECRQIRNALMRCENYFDRNVFASLIRKI